MSSTRPASIEVPPSTPYDWDQRYRNKQLPWDSGLPSRELRRVLETGAIPPGRAVELGCGTGTNAVYLAEHHFQVTACDLSPTALQLAQIKAAQAGVTVELVTADILTWEPDLEPFAFLFDRGCFHCVRTLNLEAYLQLVQRLTLPGARALILTGNAREERNPGPPVVTEEELRRELGQIFVINELRETRFEDAGGVDGPLAWACLLTRK